MKKAIVTILSCCLILLSYAQKAAKSVYAEAGGPGLLFSANYDTRFSKKENGWGGRAGVGFVVGVGPIAGISFPLGVNYLAGNRHYFEGGAGITFSTVTSGLDNVNGSSSFFFGHISAGYRYQPKKNGFLFRIAVDPLFSSDGIFFWAGLGMGYKF